MKDPEFLAEAKKLNLDVNPLSAKTFHELMAELYATPKPVLEKAAQAYEAWKQSYPRDEVTYTNLGAIDSLLGRYDKSLAETQEAFRLNPSGLNYTNLMTGFLCLNRLDEARATAEDAHAKKLDSPYLRAALYPLAFVKNDSADMARQVACASGKSGIEDTLLGMDADSNAYFGRVRKAERCRTNW